MDPEEVALIASENEGRYLLLRRYGRRENPPSELDREYDACQYLVDGGRARWISGKLAPGIELLDRQREDEAHD